MSHISRTYKLYIVATLLVCAAFILDSITADAVERSDLALKRGKVEAAECIEARSVSGIKLLVDYSRGPEDDFVLTPAALDCEEVSAHLVGNEIHITYFQNTYFGVSSGGAILRDTETELAAFNDKSGSVVFVLIIGAIAVAALYFRGRHVTSQSSRPL